MWYQSPIRPFDPVIEMDQATGTIRYVRDNFTGCGQNSFVQPPSQDQGLFSYLQNFQPITRGILDRRPGYTFTNIFTWTGGNSNSSLPVFSFEYQNDTQGARRLIWCQYDLGTVFATNEDGTTYNPNVTGHYTGIVTPQVWRMVASRDWGYFLNSSPGLNSWTTRCLKWNGANSGSTWAPAVPPAWADWAFPNTYGLAQWGVDPPASPINIVNSSPYPAGVVTLTSGRTYYYVYQCGINGSNTLHISDLSPVSIAVTGSGYTTGPVMNNSIPLGAIYYSPDPQVDTILLLATADGGDQTTLYLLDTLVNPPNQPVGTSTPYTDNTPELNLLANNVYQETDSAGLNHGVADNSVPPFAYGLNQLTSSPANPVPSVQRFMVNHLGRLWMAGGQSLFYSKNLSDMTTSTDTICGKWEEAWPAANVFPISSEAETVTGLLSDGVTLYIGTQRHIRKLSGDSPTGTNPFVFPGVLFNDVGVASQETWKMVYNQGAPVGCMWLTPDRRVIASNFQSYGDVGTPVQDILNSINPLTLNNVYQTGRPPTVLNLTGTCHAAFWSSFQRDMYVLAVCTGNSTTVNTVLMYDVRGGQWHTWVMKGFPTTMLFNLAMNGAVNLYFSYRNTVYSQDQLFRFDDLTVMDENGLGDATILPAIARTAFMHLGMPADRKWLNTLEVTTDDPAMTVTIEGASTAQDFVNPTPCLTAVPLSLDPFGVYKVQGVANPTNPTRWRYYRFTYSSVADTFPVLRGYNLEALPIHKL